MTNNYLLEPLTLDEKKKNLHLYEPVTSDEKKVNMIINIQVILFYSLILVISLGVNNLFISIFNSFPSTQHIIGKTTYVIVIFGITLFIAHSLSTTIEV